MAKDDLNDQRIVKLNEQYSMQYYKDFITTYITIERRIALLMINSPICSRVNLPRDEGLVDFVNRLDITLKRWMVANEDWMNFDFALNRLDITLKRWKIVNEDWVVLDFDLNEPFSKDEGLRRGLNGILFWTIDTNDLCMNIGVEIIGEYYTQTIALTAPDSHKCIYYTL